VNKALRLQLPVASTCNAPAACSEKFDELCCNLYTLLHCRQVLCPVPVLSKAQRLIELAALNTAAGTPAQLAVRLLTWVDGPLMTDSSSAPAAVMESAGTALAAVDVALAGFEHPGLQRQHAWDMAHTAELQQFLPYIQEESGRELVSEVLTAFSREVLPLLPTLRTAVIHSDYHDANIVLAPDGQSVAGLLDFGDAVQSALVFEPAIAMCYAMLVSSSTW
jgi:Ser/Thr protein kinase RdoA (MazF antagonist)